MNNSKFKVEFTLKQHTPIIHFQSEQVGATLRATELKPKFDRFLLEHVKDLPYKKNANESKSLDYKVNITTVNSTVETIEQINPRNGKEIPDPLFFGNMGDGKKKKFVSADGVKIEFKSFNETLLKAISQNFEAFLAQTNFGTRQSKGYGSFYIENKNFDASLISHRVHSFNTANWKKDIKLFYSFLRAGINTANFGGIYAKAAIFSYAKSKGMSWDKKAIKAKYISDENINSEEYNLVRDLFGLSSEQSWMSYKATISKEGLELGRDKKPLVERFKSPITFKKVGNKVYFWADKSVENILNKSFKITYNKKGDLKLSTPAEFSFDDFFTYVTNIDLSKYIDQSFHNDKNGEYMSLVKIIKDIKESRK